MSGDDALTKGDIGAHLRRLAVPASVGFFFNVLFNITDTFCAGLYSTEAQTALAFSFVLFFIILSVAVGLSQAASGLFARALGANKKARARYFAGQMSAVVAALGAVLMLIGALAARPLLEIMGAQPEQTRLVLDYLSWVYAGAPLMLGTLCLSGMLSAQGDTKTFRNALISSALLNLLLDPMLMFGWLGLPALGMRGIGLATFIAYLFQLSWLLLVYVRTPYLRGIRAVFFLPRWKAVRVILTQGYPATLNMFAINAGFFINTFFIARIDVVAVASYGIALRIEQLVLLLTIGLNIGMLSVAGQNYGARRFDRVHETFRAAMRYGLIVALSGSLFMLVAGRGMMWLFNREAQVIDYGYQYLVVASLLSPVYIVIHTYVAMLQALGRPAMIGPLGALRLILLPLIFNYLLVISLGFGTKGVWISLASANVIAVTVIYLYSRSLIRNLCPAVPAAAQ